MTYQVGLPQWSASWSCTETTQPIPIRALILREDDGGPRFTQCTIHRYTSAGGVDVPQTDAVFTTRGVVETDRIFGRIVKARAIWLQFAVYFVAPDSRGANDRHVREVLVFKVGSTSLRHLVNIRTSDRKLALAAAKT